MHAAKAGTLPNHRREVLLPALDHALPLILAHRAETEAADNDEHRTPPTRARPADEAGMAVLDNYKCYTLAEAARNIHPAAHRHDPLVVALALGRSLDTTCPIRAKEPGISRPAS
jgi:hypothetical protein